MDPNHTEDGYWPNDWPGHDPDYDPDRASIDDECAGIFAEREPRSRASGRSGHHRASDATWARARADYLAGESASVVCDRYGMRVSTLRNRAAEEGWRRQDQPAPEPVDLEAELEAGLPDYADMANHALIRLNRVILKGHATEAGRWMRLHRTLLDMARKPVFLPPRGRGTAAQSAGVEGVVPQAKPNPLMDALEAQVAEIQAMARSLARANSDGSDGSDGKLREDAASPPHLGWGGGPRSGGGDLHPAHSPQPSAQNPSVTAQDAPRHLPIAPQQGGDHSDPSDSKFSSPPHLDGEGDRIAVEGAAVPCPKMSLAAPAVMSHGSAAPSVTPTAPSRHLPANGEEMREAVSDPSDPSDGISPPAS
ncbi:hypothetical protein [Brevundimonas sp.]|uniref:hypothetical protein n=1 Tax=Brevundimonas sp. TaxID=1871086 RepID=UPI001DDE62E5|nr:hypothetical protein [Brevundimonas sp.]MBL0947446.1 hypothetical protein [Brevundimonas sp.]